MARKLPKARRRIHRAFLKWMRENQHRFLIPVNIRQRTDQGIELDFIGYHPAISAWLSNWCIGVSVDWQGQCWDLLCSFESAPSPVTGGYHCLLCSPGNRQIFSSRDALWTTEVFEHFLNWVNETLAPANWVALYGFSGSTMARLSPAPPEAGTDLFAVLPCRSNTRFHKNSAQ